MQVDIPSSPARPGIDRFGLAITLMVGTAVAVLLGVVGAAQPVPRLLPVWWFTSMQSMKAWLATAVLVVLVFQVLTAGWFYRWWPGVRRVPAWVRPLHRVSGTVAFLLSLPVAFYCLYSFGFDTTTPRTQAHSIAGCVFYGAFASKMTGLRFSRLPGWTIPVLGGSVFAAFVVAWYHSAYWWFELIGYAR
jgi:hypothetical protein